MLDMSSTSSSFSDSGVGSSPEAQDPPPMSRTYQYRKIMKPLLERKRRARINKCLDDLKDIMVSYLQAEGESITKLEKADVLELTVRHLKKLKANNALGLTPEATYAGTFQAGYSQCASEVSKYLSESKVLEPNASVRLLSYLDSQLLIFKKSKPTSHSRPNSAFSPVVPKEERISNASWRPW
ncbi:enhancer of split mbeta protein [Lepeophtheirus salmonis]|uniref:enhancer of split mbeta protein n=1 Tax=Lepeophtheirus salmonis TaxID=72036 RepID=UPI001AE9D19F|nr:enhancer of split mbeta protein-like [Lepeophtheirus salmonis]